MDPLALLHAGGKPWIEAGGLVITEDGAWPSGEAAVPTAPSGLAASPLGQTSIGLMWDDNSSDETGFRVERSPDGSGSWVDVSGALAANTETYTDTGLVCATQYFYRIVAFNVDGDSSPSSSADATTNPCPIPPAGSQNRIGGTGAVRKPPRPTG